MPENKRLKLRARMQPGTGQDGLTLEFTDTASRIKILKVDIPYNRVGEALHGAGGDVNVELTVSDLFGDKKEVKTEEIWLPRTTFARSSPEFHLNVSQAVASFEVKGWEADRSCLEHSNNIVRDRKPPTGSGPGTGDWYKVHFFRWGTNRRQV